MKYEGEYKLGKYKEETWWQHCKTNIKFFHEIIHVTTYYIILINYTINTYYNNYLCPVLTYIVNYVYLV